MLDFAFQKSLKGANGDFLLDIQAQIPQGHRVSLVGESGAGKSTILRILCGLQKPDCGRISYCGQTWLDSHFSLPPQERNIGFVFQNHLLFPNLSVLQNISYGAKANPKRVEQLIEVMQLSQIAHQRPSKLSGGQSQRVALARALAIQPSVLLLDEPLSALDHHLKNQILDYLLELQKELNFTMILISHNLSEIYRLSESILTLSQGKIQSTQTPKQLCANSNITLQGEILQIDDYQLTAEVKLLIAEEILTIICDPQEAQNLKVGMRLKIIQKAFSPILQPLGNGWADPSS